MKQLLSLIPLSSLLCCIFLLMTGCREKMSNDDLRYLNDKVNQNNASEILTRLDSIDETQLSESDRYFSKLIRIKAEDKSFIPHTSDSTILTIVNYFSNHGDRDQYSEALYYAGRVYADMGDYPRPYIICMRRLRTLVRILLSSL